MSCDSFWQSGHPIHVVGREKVRDGSGKERGGEGRKGEERGGEGRRGEERGGEGRRGEERGVEGSRGE